MSSVVRWSVMAVVVSCVLFMMNRPQTSAGDRCHREGGALIWQDQFDLERNFDAPAALAASDGCVYIASSSETATIVRALTLDAGALIWQKRLRQQIRIVTAAVAANRLFLAGAITVPGPDGDQEDGFVRALNARTGKRLWTYRFDLDNEADRGSQSEAVLALTVAHDRVLIAGSGAFNTMFIDPDEGSLVNERRAFLVQALEASTGAEMWRHQLGADTENGRATAMVAQAEHVVAAGEFAGHSIVRALHMATGELQWEDRFDYGSRDTEAAAVAADDRHVYVAGNSWMGVNEIGFVRALDIRDGAIQWHDQIPGYTRPNALIASNAKVFVAGFIVTSSIDALLRALDAERGRFLWQDQFDLGGKRDFIDAIAVAKGVLVAAGFSPKFLL